MADNIRCPRCGSSDIHSDKKGFSTGKAVAGTLAAGLLVGAAAGTIGSNNIRNTCLVCGHTFKPGEQLKENNNGPVQDLEQSSSEGYIKVAEKEQEIPWYKCHNCSKESMTDKKFCPKCGSPFAESDKIDPTKKGGCSFVLLLLVGVVSLASYILINI